MSNYLDNPKARFDYEILERFDAGIELLGYEVKSVRAGHGSLTGAHVIVRGGEVFIVGLRIDPYQVGNTPPDYQADQTRKLLLTKKEIYQLEESDSKKGLTLIPLSLYNKGGKIKVNFAIARGKKKFDKRETIKKRDTDRDIRRELKR
ncbi:MAG: SsrA-binding protein SmpB [Candidatus Pacebacteria bacterium]|nr:SsrA-binding protein SmpB [Candidatus Paceibacterota bacterium]